MDTATYFDALKASFSHDEATAAKIGTLRDQYDRRLWHEFSDGLLALVESHANVRAASLDLHSYLLVPIRADMSPATYVKLLYLACAGGDEELTREKTSEMLDSAAASMIGLNQPQYKHAIDCIKALLLMGQGQGLQAKRILTDVEDYIRSVPVQDIAVVLQALYHRALARQYELNGDHDAFYPTAFAFASYGESAGVPILPGEIAAVAYKTAIAALLARKIFNFGRLLTFTMFADALRASPDTAWALQLAEACNNGDMPAYAAFVRDNTALIAAIPDLHQAIKTTLSHKVRLMALLHLVFHTPADERMIGFDVIAARCEITEAEVEPLLLSGFALGLLKGKIDELQRVVDVTWVQARVLSMEEIGALADTIAKWRKLVAETAEQVAESAKDIPS